MEVEEKNTKGRKPKVQEEKVPQILTALAAPTIRELVTVANKYGIKREDVVTIIKENGQYILLHYSPSV